MEANTTGHGRPDDRLRRLELERERARALLDTALEQLPSGVVVADGPQLQIRMVNSAALEILGETRESLVGRPALQPRGWRAFRPDGAPYQKEDLPLFRAVLRGEVVRNEEAIIESADGERRWVLASATPFASADSEVVAGVVVFRDVTERRRAEEEQRRLQEELRASEAMSAMGALLAGVAHEVRNPLFSISATVEAFEARFGSEEAAPYLEVLHKEVERLSNLMRDLLQFGRPPSLDLSREPIDRAVSEAVTESRMLAKELGVELVTRVSAGLPPVLVAHDRIREVLHNLIENAVQHSSRGAAVAVEVRAAEHGGVECSVTDSGPGFRPEDLPQVFDPFFSRREDGIGIGLSLVKKVVEEHRGSVRATNRAGGGAEVTFQIPAAPAEPELGVRADGGPVA